MKSFLWAAVATLISSTALSQTTIPGGIRSTDGALVVIAPQGTVCDLTVTSDAEVDYVGDVWQPVPGCDEYTFPAGSGVYIWGPATISGVYYDPVLGSWAWGPIGWGGPADFNMDCDVGTDADIEAFFACLSHDCPSADFNDDGDSSTDQDIEAFFRVLGGG